MNPIKVNLIYCDENSVEIMPLKNALQSKGYTVNSIRVGKDTFSTSTSFINILTKTSTQGILCISDNFLKNSVCMENTAHFFTKCIQNNQLLPIITKGRYLDETASEGYKFRYTQLKQPNTYLNYWQSKNTSSIEQISSFINFLDKQNCLLLEGDVNGGERLVNQIELSNFFGLNKELNAVTVITDTTKEAELAELLKIKEDILVIRKETLKEAEKFRQEKMVKERILEEDRQRFLKQKEIISQMLKQEEEALERIKKELIEELLNKAQKLADQKSDTTIRKMAIAKVLKKEEEYERYIQIIKESVAEDSSKIWTEIERLLESGEILPIKEVISDAQRDDSIAITTKSKEDNYQTILKDMSEGHESFINNLNIVKETISKEKPSDLSKKASLFSNHSDDFNELEGIEIENIEIDDSSTQWFVEVSEIKKTNM